MTAEEVRYGYTMADLDRIARQAAVTGRRFVSDFADGYDAAWYAVTEHLLTAAAPPRLSELAGVARYAVLRLADDRTHHHGYSTTDPDAGAGSSARFAAYWQPTLGQAMDEWVCERIALAQVLAALPAETASDITAAASAGRAAGEASRQAFLRLWYAPEPPPAAYRPYAGSGCGTHGGYRRHLRRGETPDEACRRAYLQRERARKTARNRAREVPGAA